MVKHLVRALSTAAILLLAGWLWPAQPLAAARTTQTLASPSLPANDNPLNIRASLATTSTLFLPLIQKFTGHWVTILADDFEGPFPGQWLLYDGGNYSWASRTCAAHSGTHSAWAVGGGTSGAGLACGSKYPYYAYTMLYYGPFDLTGATAADMSYYMMVNLQGGDYICPRGSSNNFQYFGACIDGPVQSAWFQGRLDLNHPGTGSSLLGQPQVWVAFQFESFGQPTFPNGALVDDVVLRKCVGGICSPATASLALPAGVVETPREWTRPSMLAR